MRFGLRVVRAYEQQEPDAPYCAGLLRARRDWPCGCGAKCGNEFPSSHDLIPSTGQGIVAGPAVRP